MALERILIATGGTGGHIFPAIAVAQEVTRRNPNVSILFTGANEGVEADIVTKAGYRFVGLPVRGIMGKGFRGATNAFAMLRGIGAAVSIVKKADPQVVIGFGGYAAFAGTLAGALCKKPSAIHEQNSFPGMANKILGKIIDTVFLSVPGTEEFFPKNKTLLTGNPIRKEIERLTVHFAQKHNTENLHPTRLLVMGGSLGAKALNNGMLANINAFIGRGIEVWHQTGTQDYEFVRQTYRDAGAGHVRVEAFIEDMAAAYTWADLVLCRAGASSIAELTVAGLPAIFVPFPFAAQNHQLYNAKAMVTQGAALLLEQKEFEGSHSTVLADTALALFSNTEKLFTMAQKSHALAKPNAASKIVDKLENLASTGVKK